MRKSDALFLAACPLLIIAVVVFWTWLVMRGRDDRKEVFEAQCRGEGGKLVTSYTANYLVDHVICVPVGLNPSEVLRLEK